jgi:Ca2+:H+ antiporter
MSGCENGVDIESGNAPSPQSPLLGNRPDLQVVHLANPLEAVHIILSNGYINILLVFLPFAIISGALEWSPTVVFITNFFALMPLASLLNFVTCELSKKVGQGIGRLLKVTFGNATELIVGIVALRDGQVILIQTTMLGSVLSSLLFVPNHTHDLNVGTWNNFCSCGDADCRL